MADRINKLIHVSGSAIDFSFNIDEYSQADYFRLISQNIEWFVQTGKPFMIPDEVLFHEQTYMKGYAIYALDNHLLVTEATVEVDADRMTLNPSVISSLLSLDDAYSSTRAIWPWHQWLDSEGLEGLYRSVSERLGYPPKEIKLNNKYTLPISTNLKVESNVDNLRNPEDLCIRVIWNHNFDEMYFDDDRIDPIKLLDSHIDQIEEFCKGRRKTCTLTRLYDVEDCMWYGLELNSCAKAYVEVLSQESKVKGAQRQLLYDNSLLSTNDIYTNTTSRIENNQPQRLLENLREIRDKLAEHLDTTK
jgi:hypothetical protein